MLKRCQRWLWRITGAQAEIERALQEGANLRLLCLHYGVQPYPCSVRTLRGFEQAVERFCREHLPIGCQARVSVTEEQPGLVDVAIHVERRCGS